MKLRILLIITILLFTFHSQGSHIAGGHISYRYIGDSTGIVNEYEFTMTLYRDMQGQTMPATITINACSSCFSTSTFALNQTSANAQILSNLFDCVNPATVGFNALEIHTYKGTYTLPGNCSDWQFTHLQCCRNGGVSNLEHPSSQGIYLIAELDNSNPLIKNTSARFKNESIRAVGAGYLMNLSFAAENRDNDSLVYHLISPKTGAGCTYNDIPHEFGYSTLQPITTTPPQSATFSNQTAVFSGIPATAELNQIAIRVEEYRFDSASFNWQKIGGTLIDFPLYVVPNLSLAQSAGTMLNYNASNLSLNPNTGAYELNVDCADTLIPIRYVNNLECNTISPDGTDFRILDPDGQPFPIIAARFSCDNLNRTKIISLQPAFNFTKNGRYVLTYKTGNDGNGIVTSCGVSSVEGDSIVINVSGCSNVGLNENTSTKIDVFPNPTSGIIYFSQNGLTTDLAFNLNDLSGKQLYSGVNNHLNISELPSGIYLLSLTFRNQIYHFKVVRQ